MTDTDTNAETKTTRGVANATNTSGERTNANAASPATDDVTTDAAATTGDGEVATGDGGVTTSDGDVTNGDVTNGDPANGEPDLEADATGADPADDRADASDADGERAPGDPTPFETDDDGDAPAGFTGDPIDILLVEDNPGDVRLTKEAFRNGRIDNTIHVVTDGVEALEFLRQRGEYADAPTPDVVLLDLNLPRKNGDEVLRELKTDPELKPIPVIVLTSSKAEEDVVKSYELHANAYLTKPVDPADFIDTIQSFERFWLSVVRLPPEEEL